MSDDYSDALSVAKADGAILLDGIQVADTVQCVHCGGHFTPRRNSGAIRGWCMKCHGVVCGPKCSRCVPFEKKLANAERIGHR